MRRRSGRTASLWERWLCGRRSLWLPALILALSLPQLALGLTQAQKIAIVRELAAKFGVIQLTLPQGKTGLILIVGQGVVNAAQAQQQALNVGAAAHPGQRVQVTAIDFKRKELIFEINGGPVKSHWYDHISIGMNNADVPIHQEKPADGGSAIALRFPQGVPSGITAAQLEAYLRPAIDFSPRADYDMLIKSMPPVLRKAILSHTVLVGMNKSMVIAARGRTNLKISESDPTSGKLYQDWIYGKPPATLFVRFEGDRVVKVTEYKQNGGEVVWDRPMIQIAAPPKRQERNQPAPSLLRPGEHALKGRPHLTGAKTGRD